MATNKVTKDFLTDDEMDKLEFGDSSDFISDEEMAKIESNVQPTKLPILENPFKGLSSAYQNIKKDITETKTLPESEKPEYKYQMGQYGMTVPASEDAAKAYFGGLHGAASIVGNAAMAPFNVLGATFPRATESLKKGVDKVASGLMEESPIQRTLYGPASNPIPGLMEIKGKASKKYPVATQTVGDILNIAGSIPALKMEQAIVKNAPGKSIEIAGKVLPDEVSQSFENFATRSQNRQVKINSPEWNMGARPELNAKYGVIGKKAEDAAKQWNAIEQPIFESLSTKIAGQLDNPENFTTIEELKNHAQNVIKRSNADKDWKRIQLEALDKRIGSLSDGSGLYATYKNGMIDIAEAQKLKIRTGRDGAWYTNGKGAMSDPEAPLKSQVANALYDALKVSVENKGSAGIKELNKALSEIIPMKLAAEKRMMVDKRNNFNSLDDVVAISTALISAGSGNFLPAIFAGGNMAVKSPILAKQAYDLSMKMRGQKIPKGIEEIQKAIAMPEKKYIPLSEEDKILGKQGTFKNEYSEGLPGFLRLEEGPKLEIPKYTEADLGPYKEFRDWIKKMEDYNLLEEKKARPRIFGGGPNEGAKQPITDPRLLLPAPMIGTGLEKIQPMIPTMGERIRAIGKFEDLPKQPITEKPKISILGEEYDPFTSNLLTKKQLNEMKKLEKGNIEAKTISGDYPTGQALTPEEFNRLLTPEQFDEMMNTKQMELSLGNKNLSDVLGEDYKKKMLESAKSVQSGNITSKDAPVGYDRKMLNAIAENPQELQAWSTAFGMGRIEDLTDTQYVELMQLVARKKQELQ